MKPIDIFICAYLRPMFTEQTLIYLKERTKYPYRLFLINNGGNEDIAKVYEKDIFMTINMSKNAGVTAAWQIALALAESEYFITSDNDIYVPDLKSYTEISEGENLILQKNDPDYEKKLEEFKKSSHKTITKYLQEDISDYDNLDWLERLVKLMDERPDFGAISLSPHVLIGDAQMDPNDPEDVKEVPWCGAVMRIMRRDLVKKVNGWADDNDPLIRGDRGHEERLVCGRLKEAGYKSGRCTRLRAYHPFGSNWGYPEEITPEEQGHNPELKDYVKQFDQMEVYDQKTWLPKA